MATLDPQTTTRTKFLLDESEIPTHWYNVVPDLPHPPAPVLHPGTGQPIGPADLAPLFPMALIAQEVSQDKTIEIPDEVRDVYRLWRPYLPVKPTSGCADRLWNQAGCRFAPALDATRTIRPSCSM